MQQNIQSGKTPAERVFHAVGFEVIATAICAPVAAWAMERSVLEMGGLSLVLATTAMLWNIVYNAIFDRLWPAAKTPRVRVFHALGFEVGFIVFGLAIVCQTLGVGILQAFMLEVGFFLFFLPYTVAYNWIYDILRERYMARRGHNAALDRS
ncbi:multidrug/biocide efflux PACE transporter [Enterobacillus tribolii]|uniref:Putative membrane protein n=1 Tax=Enterobacillus tribolii TaxID=1487935 RepID=A0A370QRQ1_9GAMM|nr:multidrug/biocide efflux PACE transporter [Enterobacillus tribolii]MBW7983562.1 multidrug/biocide efflux PACE transporter [Enterobacillus tribolii]RDK91940.1 putative membrane protein [Enterobacillus tribolii]